MRFRRKRLEKQTHIDNFSLKKNPKRIHLVSLYRLKSESSIRENFTFFRKKTFSNLVFPFIAEKKITKTIYNFFFRTPKLQNKKIRNMQNFV